MLFAGMEKVGSRISAVGMQVARFGLAGAPQPETSNLDGFEDIAVAQNYKSSGSLPWSIAMPELLLNAGGQYFEPVERQAGVANRLFAIHLICDLNGDSRRILQVNPNGRSRAFLNRMPNANSVTLRFDDSPSAYGAIITASFADRLFIRRIVPGQGLASDQSANIFLGLGTDRQIDHLRVTFPNE